MNSIRKLADAIINDIRSGLRGQHTNMSISTEQLEEEIIQYRLAIIKEYMLKGVLPIKDLLVSINCIPVDCDNLAKCKCNPNTCGEPMAHFEIPQILFDYGTNQAIQYIGSVDRQHPFSFSTKAIDKLSTVKKYRKRGKNKPWVYIDVTPNENGNLDCFIFNAPPLVKQVSITAIFKDPRQLEELQCNCEEGVGDVKKVSSSQMDNNMNFIDMVIKERLTKIKLYYYRQVAAPILPNNQEYEAG